MMSLTSQNNNMSNYSNDDDDFPIQQVPYLDTDGAQEEQTTGPQNETSAQQQPKPAFTFAPAVPTTNTAAFAAFAANATPTVPTTNTAAFGFYGTQLKATTSTASAQGHYTSAFGLGGVNPGIGLGMRVERHPETGQPIQMGCNLQPPPQMRGMCGGIHSHPGSSQNNQPFGLKLNNDNKKKTMEDLYKKLAAARTQIQSLNKIIDEIYETLPNIN